MTTTQKKRYVLEHKDKSVRDIVDVVRAQIENETNAKSINYIFNKIIILEDCHQLMRNHTPQETTDNIIKMLADELTGEEIEILEENL